MGLLTRCVIQNSSCKDQEYFVSYLLAYWWNHPLIAPLLWQLSRIPWKCAYTFWKMLYRPEGLAKNPVPSRFRRKWTFRVWRSRVLSSPGFCYQGFPILVMLEQQFIVGSGWVLFAAAEVPSWVLFATSLLSVESDKSTIVTSFSQ